MLGSLCKTQMLHCQYHNLILSSVPPPNHIPSLSKSFPSNPSAFCSVSVHTRPRPVSWLAGVTEPDVSTIVPEDGPINLLPSSTSIFATTDDPTPLQLATSVMLTGAISIFLFRSLRRREKRAKELKLRSTGANKSLMEEALDSLKALRTGTVGDDSPPKPAQALLGGISAGVIALILYKFTLTVEAGLNRQALISDNYSVRQIIITIRTVVNGLFYLATFVFGVNSAGLLFYSGKLAIDSSMDNSSSEGTESKGEGGMVSSNNTTESDGSKETEGSTDTQP